MARAPSRRVRRTGVPVNPLVRHVARESFERETADADLTIEHLQINLGEIWAAVHQQGAS